MAGWYNKVVDNLAEVPNFVSFYQNELVAAKNEVKIFGKVEKNLADLPGVTEFRFGQLQEIEAVLNYLNIQLKVIRRNKFKHYLEHYNRALSARDAEKYVDGEQDVVDMDVLINEVALLRNQWLGIMKGLETKSFMIGHITRLRTAGMEDASL